MGDGDCNSVPELPQSPSRFGIRRVATKSLSVISTIMPANRRKPACVPSGNRSTMACPVAQPLT